MSRNPTCAFGIRFFFANAAIECTEMPTANLPGFTACNEAIFFSWTLPTSARSNELKLVIEFTTLKLLCSCLPPLV
jgi:hypothetical protein